MASLVYQKKLLAVIKGISERTAMRIERELAPDAEALADEARRTHPWQNRTGRLEASIEGHVTREGTQVSVTVGYDASGVSDEGFPYGARLETDYGGAYATLRPALLRKQGEIVAKIREIASVWG